MYLLHLVLCSILFLFSQVFSIFLFSILFCCFALFSSLLFCFEFYCSELCLQYLVLCSILFYSSLFYICKVYITILVKSFLFHRYIQFHLFLFCFSIWFHLIPFHFCFVWIPFCFTLFVLCSCSVLLYCCFPSSGSLFNMTYYITCSSTFILFFWTHVLNFSEAQNIRLSAPTLACTVIGLITMWTSILRQMSTQAYSQGECRWQPLILAL